MQIPNHEGKHLDVAIAGCSTRCCLGWNQHLLFISRLSDLTVSHQNYQKLAGSPVSTLRDLAIAEAAENRHRINCFAEGVGALLGGIILSVGIHGICTVSTQPDRPS